MEHDEHYYLEWEFVVLKVENRLFRIPQALLSNNSEVFVDMFRLPQGLDKVPEGSSDTNPIIVPSGITVDEFQYFMRVLLPLRPYDESSSIPITGWIAILKLSTLWNAPALRKAAIGKIDSELETWKATNNAEESSKFPAVLLPSNLVLLGREYSVDKWILHGYRSLVNTDKRMSELDAQTIGWKQAYQVMLLREERYKEQVLWGGSGLVADSRIRDTFQLEIPVLAPTLCERESIPARKKRRG